MDVKAQNLCRAMKKKQTQDLNLVLCNSVIFQKWYNFQNHAPAFPVCSTFQSKTNDLHFTDLWTNTPQEARTTRTLRSCVKSHKYAMMK